MAQPVHKFLTILFAAMMTTCCSLVSAEHYEGALNPALLTTQDEINSGTVPLRTLFYRGMHFYTNRFTTNDGLGEASDGPRRSNQMLSANPRNPFLRFNGLDAQSCFECHSGTGSTRFGDISLPRDTGSIGGSAGVAASVLIFENPNDLDHGIVRSPPHNFGLGYIQRLSDEMTADLLRQRDDALVIARDTGENVVVNLESKGVHFGAVTILPNGATDRSAVEGLSIDLVVRPFQFKGVASSLRNFVAGALNFHFSVQPKELLERAFIANDNPNGTLANDQKFEVMEGEVSAIAIFLAAMRPPLQDLTDLDPVSVARGRSLMDSVGCSACHVPALRINDPLVTITDSRYLRDLEFGEVSRRKSDYISVRGAKVGDVASITAPEEFSEYLAPVVQYELKQHPEKIGKHLGRTALNPHPPGYTFNLNDAIFPDEALPRLPHNPDGSIDVPLFSDLRRHRMGSDLQDSVPQRTEMQSMMAPADEFLTRPLWGVADTGPWLHDGRATTLREAVIFHDGPGSEAAAAVAAFNALSRDDQESLLDFLRSQRLPAMAHSADPREVERKAFITR